MHNNLALITWSVPLFPSPSLIAIRRLRSQGTIKTKWPRIGISENVDFGEMSNYGKFGISRFWRFFPGVWRQLKDQCVLHQGGNGRERIPTGQSFGAPPAEARSSGDEGHLHFRNHICRIRFRIWISDSIQPLFLYQMGLFITGVIRTMTTDLSHVRCNIWNISDFWSAIIY